MAKEKLTPEQKQAAKLQQEKDKYKGHCTESALFTQNPENVADLKKLAQMVEQQNQLKTDIEQLRHRLYDNMKKVNCCRAILLSYGKQLTISKSGYTSSKTAFDVDAFKKDHPDLYNKYSYKTGGGWSPGEKLTFNNLQPKAQGYYQQFPEYFQTEKPIPQKEWSFGDVFSITEFRDMIACGAITDYDGDGDYLNEDGTLGECIDLKDILDNTHPHQYKWVIWFNK